MPRYFNTKIYIILQNLLLKLYNIFMFKRNETKSFLIGNVKIGGNNKIIIQSMCDIKTSNYKEVIKQINICKNNGAEMMRISITDFDDVNAIKKIKENTDIVLIGDIHYSSMYAIKAIENGIDKIRINPINTPKNELIKIIECAKKHNTAIRIGLNEGSTTPEGKNLNTIDELINECLKSIKLFESYDFKKIVLSIKTSSPLKTIEIYKKLADLTDYPLHIGVTESGLEDIGIIRSSVGLVPLLLDGIGNTIRISLTQNPLLEIKTCKRLLHELNLYDDYPTIISCPTCGRCKVSNMKYIVEKITEYLEENNINIKISILGCIVNGIGEGKNSDIGLAGQNGKFIIFSKGKIIKQVDENNLYVELIKEINNFIQKKEGLTLLS